MQRGREVTLPLSTRHLWFYSTWHGHCPTSNPMVIPSTLGELSFDTDPPPWQAGLKVSLGQTSDAQVTSWEQESAATTPTGHAPRSGAVAASAWPTPRNTLWMTHAKPHSSLSSLPAVQVCTLGQIPGHSFKDALFPCLIQFTTKESKQQESLHLSPAQVHPWNREMPLLCIWQVCFVTGYTYFTQTTLINLHKLSFL